MSCEELNEIQEQIEVQNVKLKHVWRCIRQMNVLTVIIFSKKVQVNSKEVKKKSWIVI